MGKSQQFQIEITSDTANLLRVSEFVRSVGNAIGMTEKQQYDVELAVDEAVTNIMEHAYDGRKDGHISIMLARRNADLVVEIRDVGKPFDSASVKQPQLRVPLGRRDIGGLGIYFMRQLMDTVEFSHNSKHGNLVRMTKRLK